MATTIGVVISCDQAKLVCTGMRAGLSELSFFSDMEAQIGEVANTFFSIGMIFWGVFGFVMVFTGFCWYKFCREGADADVCSVCC